MYNVRNRYACDSKPHVFTKETRENNFNTGIVVLTDYKITPVILTRISDSVYRIKYI